MSELYFDRRSFIKGCAALGIGAAVASAGFGLVGCSTSSSSGTKTFLYTGCWNEKGGDAGLWVHTFDTSTGKMSDSKQITDEVNVGFIAIDYDKKLLYVTDESDQPYDKEKGMSAGKGGRIFVYEVNESDGSLTEKQQVPSYGSNPSMVSLDPTGQYLVCSIHTAKPCVCTTEKKDGKWTIVPQCPTASVVLFKRNDDGTLVDPPLDCKPYRGKNHLSQLHTVTWEPNGSFFIVADKGTGDIYSLNINPAGPELQQTTDSFSLGAGYSPRYVRFHPSKKWVYLNFESANEVIVFSYDDDGKLKKIGSDKVVPQSWMKDVPSESDGGKFEQQDMKMSDDGTYLYSVFRGSSDNLVDGERVHDGGFQGVAAFKIDQDTGIPKNIQSLKLDCNWPRGCAISPDGKYLVVGSLYSDVMVTLTINDDGTLTDNGEKTDQTTAANVTFYQHE
ncbi:MAG: beta-propeller fold lactonase family protein [Coriobacteriales bacterium]|jgi:6-phosphogluconolactonase